LSVIVEQVRVRPAVDFGGKVNLYANPYVIGAAIGVLSWIVFAIADDPLGITTSFSALAGLAAMPFVGAATVWHNSYWAQNAPSLSYGALFLVGVIAGAFAAAWFNRQIRLQTVPATWGQRFGYVPLWRYTAAFAGGAFEMYGARLAGGCASGHGLSGTMQLALSSWIFTIVMFATAVLAGSAMFNNESQMSLPVTDPLLLPLGIVFGFAFGWLLQRGGLADTEVIIAQLRLRNSALFKVMLTAIIVGGVGVFVLHHGGLAVYHVKSTNLLAVALGAVLFGLGMALLGYCPGSALAAVGTGSLHAFAGVFGMLGGAIAFAFSFDWIKAKLLPVGAFGALRLPEMTGIPDPVWFAVVLLFGLFLLIILDRRHP